MLLIPSYRVVLATSWLLLLILQPTRADPGKWDHHSRSKVGRQQGRQSTVTTTGRPPVPTTTVKTTTTTTPPSTTTVMADRRHFVSSTAAVSAATAPAHRCQVPEEEEVALPDGRHLNMDYVMRVPDLLLEDKLLLAPVVFEGAMVSRTNTYKGLYFVSFKVLRVLKGRIHRQQLAGQVRLLFQTLTAANTASTVDSYNSSSALVSQPRGGLRGNACPPVPFNVRTGRKYLIFVRKLALGRYVAVAEPELVRKKTRKAVRRTFCPGCGEYICLCVYIPQGDKGGGGAIDRRRLL